MSEDPSKLLYKCTVYDARPRECIEYPWNFANSIFRDCIFVEEKKEEEPRLRTIEEQLEINTAGEISNYCISCGKCCFFGPAACSKLRITEGEDDDGLGE